MVWKMEKDLDIGIFSFNEDYYCIRNGSEGLVAPQSSTLQIQLVDVFLKRQSYSLERFEYRFISQEWSQ